MDFIVLGLLLCLIVVLFQDLKFRRIHIILPALIFVFSVVLFNRNPGINYTIYVANMIFFLLIITILTLYMSLKNKKFLNPFANYFGLGDLLFFIGITPLFLTYNFILFFILSMIFSIGLQLAFQKKMKEKTIPLAGFSALLLLLFMLKDVLLSYPKMTVL
ncbi:hypothetical protein [Flavobacterium wongokense]|uniref:hypothetical protein n=1 Tax=Flavobacterium wongokense TaxID=2910674 RepID=UPI001F3310B3|nr:hypothetical protein [Flavobacterium sp. WG47]MCF6133366.1 hypothetical protein [Flavobacterium sp. WG47]